jgi:hypothetical protein
MNWSKRMKDFVGGILVLLIGIGAMVQGQTYNIGTLNRMGPGYFPVALGAILAGIGGVILIAAYLSTRLATRTEDPYSVPDFRAPSSYPEPEDDPDPDVEMSSFENGTAGENGLHVRSGETAQRQPSQWRGWICIILGVAAFPVIGKYGGFVPATFAIVFISALGERENTWRGITLLALAMVAFCIGVFWWGLNIQFPLFGWGNS